MAVRTASSKPSVDFFERVSISFSIPTISRLSATPIRLPHRFYNYLRQFFIDVVVFQVEAERRLELNARCLTCPDQFAYLLVRPHI